MAPAHSTIRLPVVLNHARFYAVLELNVKPAKITVEMVFDAALKTLPESLDANPAEVTLRWITDKTVAFSPTDTNLIQLRSDAEEWYFSKGRFLKSTPLDDATLRSNLKVIMKGGPVRIYVVGPAGLPTRVTRDVEKQRMRYHEFLCADTNANAANADANTNAANANANAANADANASQTTEKKKQTTEKKKQTTEKKKQTTEKKKQKSARVVGTTWNPPPSLAATQRTVHRQAQLGPTPMYDGRQPIANNIGPSAALYHEGFMKLFHAFSSDKALDEVDLDPGMETAVYRLRHALAQPTVVDEHTYMDVLQEYLPPLFPGTTFRREYKVPHSSTSFDFALTCSSPHGVEIIVVAGEAKFRDGNGGSAPTQALYAYRRVYLLAQYHTIFLTTCCPCLILGASGPFLHVCGAYFAGHIYSTPLSVGPLSLEFGGGLGAQHNLKVARKMQAIRNTVKMLSKSYMEDHTGAYSNPDQFLPSPYIPKTRSAWASARTFRNFSLRFTDTRFTTEGHCIFRGVVTYHNSPQSSINVYVKFVPSQYNDAAVVHRHLATKGYAPVLRWHGSVCGGPYMVIMDEVPGSTIEDILLARQRAGAPPLCDEDLEPLDNAIALMQEKGYVHGDLRPPNVMLQLEKKKAFIIDFDWAGKAGVARYPNDVILNSDIKWPLPAAKMPGSLIELDHDTIMRSEILAQPRTKRNQEKLTSDWGENQLLSKTTTSKQTSTTTTTPAPVPPPSGYWYYLKDGTFVWVPASQAPAPASHGLAPASHGPTRAFPGAPPAPPSLDVLKRGRKRTAEDSGVDADASSAVQDMRKGKRLASGEPPGTR